MVQEFKCLAFLCAERIPQLFFIYGNTDVIESHGRDSLEIGLSNVRTPGLALGEDGSLTVVYSRDDRVEGDGSVLGRAFEAPEPPMFADGFESGDTTRWSGSSP